MSDTPNWISIALAEQGQTEEPGPNHNPRIVEYHARTSLAAKDDETPWCASFVSWVMTEAGLRNPNTARARDFLHYGQSLDRPFIGAIVVLSRGNSPTQGHVGFYMGERGDSILVLGGNQGNSVSIARYAKSRVLAYRWPPGVPKPEPETIVEAARTGTVGGAVEQGVIVAGAGAAGTVLSSLGAVPVPVALALIAALFVAGLIWIAHKRVRKV
jgi:uncharacterized protein (TIGR02594 family)